MKLYNYKTFNESIKSDNDIHEICKKYGIRNYTINPDGTIDVDGSVDFVDSNLDTIPLKFKSVRGSFDCSFNGLYSLEGCPEYVGGSFDCGYNNSRHLNNLNGGLNSLKGCPKTIMGSFRCQNNDIRDFKWFPENYYGTVYFDRNPVDVLLRMVNRNKECIFIHLLNEYDVIRNGKTIIRDRLEAAYDGVDVILPSDINIYGYEII